MVAVVGLALVGARDLASALLWLSARLWLSALRAGLSAGLDLSARLRPVHRAGKVRWAGSGGQVPVASPLAAA